MILYSYDLRSWTRSPVRPLKYTHHSLHPAFRNSHEILACPIYVVRISTYGDWTIPKLPQQTSFGWPEGFKNDLNPFWVLLREPLKAARSWNRSESQPPSLTNINIFSYSSVPRCREESDQAIKHVIVSLACIIHYTNQQNIRTHSFIRPIPLYAEPNAPNLAPRIWLCAAVSSSISLQLVVSAHAYAVLVSFDSNE